MNDRNVGFMWFHVVVNPFVLLDCSTYHFGKLIDQRATYPMFIITRRRDFLLLPGFVSLRCTMLSYFCKITHIILIMQKIFGII